MIQFRDLFDLFSNPSGPEIWLEISSGQIIFKLPLSSSLVGVLAGKVTSCFQMIPGGSVPRDKPGFRRT